MNIKGIRNNFAAVTPLKFMLSLFERRINKKVTTVNILFCQPNMKN